ncbi:hypothetical protein PHLH3_42390 [Pseudomonas sp. St386]|nr:hypothetical protein PHLH3_42390 [Pseudomonas sp. St386]
MTPSRAVLSRAGWECAIGLWDASGGQMGDERRKWGVGLQKGPTYRWELACLSIYCVVFVGASVYSFAVAQMATGFGDPQWAKTIQWCLLMNQYMGLTSNAVDHPLYVDTTAPLHILLDSAAYQIRAATQFLENLAMRDEQTIEPATLQDLAQLCCIPLRDGCDVMDVIALRLDTAPVGSTL